MVPHPGPVGRPDAERLPQVAVVLAAGTAPVPTLVRQALLAMPTPGDAHSPGPWLVTAAGRPRHGADDVASTVAAALTDLAGDDIRPETAYPPHPPVRLGAALRGASEAAWVPIPVRTPGARFPTVHVPRHFLSARLVAAVDLTAAARGAAPLALGHWARHVHPRQGLPARAAGDRSALVVDLAAAFRPRLLVLLGRLGALNVAAVTADLVAAELIALALLADLAAPDVETLGPWEDPLVQRATELGLGVASPTHLRLVIPDTEADDRRLDGTDALAGRLRLRLGIPSP